MDENSNKIHDYLDELLAKSSEFARTVAEETGKLPTNTERQKVVLLLLASALTHYRAMNFLLDDGRYIASALALVRSVADASFRAIWIARLATDDEFSAAWNSDDPKKWPNPRKVTQLLQGEFNQVLSDELDRIKQEWGHMSGFVHTGSSQLRSLSRYHSQGYPDTIQVTIITKSSLYLNYAACLAATAVSALEVAKRIDMEFDALDKFGEEILRQTKSTVH